MDQPAIYSIVRDSLAFMSGEFPDIKPLPPDPDRDAILESLGVDEVVFSDFVEDLEKRFDGRRLSLERFLSRQELSTLTMGKLLDHLEKALAPKIKAPIVVYVDDEEENLFVFRRRYAKAFNLKTFTDPLAALKFIQSDPNVALVITDEVMPILNGNALCDRVREFKPALKFILITGNPNSDEDLMYNTLRENRFYEFIRKPMNLEQEGERYLQMIRKLID